MGQPMTHRFKIANWHIRPDLLEADNGSQCLQFSEEHMKLLQVFAETDEPGLDFPEIQNRLTYWRAFDEPYFLSQIETINHTFGLIDGAGLVVRFSNGCFGFSQACQPLLTASPHSQPQWMVDQQPTIRPTMAGILPMALITGLAMVLGIFWMKGLFQLEPWLPTPTLQKITDYPGRESDGVVSPDGHYLAFSWDAGPGMSNLFLKDLRSQEILQLTQGVSLDHSPSWSPDSKHLAFIRQSHLENTIFLLELKTAEEIPLQSLASQDKLGLSWSPDGQSIAYSDIPQFQAQPAIMSIGLKDRHVEQISFPPQTQAGDFLPRYSPSGEQLAFLRGGEEGEHYVLTTSLRSGESDLVAISHGDHQGLTWLSEQHLIFTSEENGSSQLKRVDLATKEVISLPGTSVNARSPSFEPGSQFLTFERTFENADILSFHMDASPWPKAPKVITSSPQWETMPQLSRDGTKIAYVVANDTGSQLWVADAWGRKAKAITPASLGWVHAPKWSPDGKQLAFQATGFGNIHSQIFSFDFDNQHLQIHTAEADQAQLPSWSADSTSLYFQAVTQHRKCIKRLELASGNMEVVAEIDAILGEVSPDGKNFYYVKSDDETSIWRLDLERGTSDCVLQKQLSHWGNWSVTASGLYFVKDLNGSSALAFLDWDARCSKIVRTLPFVPESMGFSMTFDAKRYVLVEKKPAESDIMMLPLH